MNVPATGPLVDDRVHVAQRERGAIAVIDRLSNDAEFSKRAVLNQSALANNLKRHYDFIVCGAGSSGSVVARRLAECPSVNVLLVEAGGTDDVQGVMCPELWPTNLGSERDWGFVAEPNPHLNGRAISMSMGKV